MDNLNVPPVREWLALRCLRFWAWAWAWPSECAADAIAGLADCRDIRQSVRACLHVFTSFSGVRERILAMILEITM